MLPVIPLWGSHLFDLSPAAKPSPVLSTDPWEREGVASGNLLHGDFQEGDQHAEEMAWLDPSKEPLFLGHLRPPP